MLKPIYGTTSDWAGNPVVPAGRIAVEKTPEDVMIVKIGNGVQHYADLAVEWQGLVSSGGSEFDPTELYGLINTARTEVRAVQYGGTGSNTPAGARTNLGAAAADHNHAGVYLTTETDPTVPAWAKNATKPSYTYSEVGAAASGHTHNYAGSSSVGGPAATALALNTARTLTIGSTGKTFDGSANVSWSLAEIGAAASGHTHNYAGSSSAGGPAATALKLNAAVNLTVGNTAKSFDGSLAVSWSLNEIGAADVNHTHTGVYSPVGHNHAGVYLTEETDPTVPSWAKAVSKPSYTYSEVGAAAAAHNHAGVYLTAETDPSVPAWAKNATKPSYTYSEVGAAAATHSHAQSDVTGLSTSLGAKADKVSTPTAGHFAGLDVNGNLTDSSYNAANFATSGHNHAGVYLTAETDPTVSAWAKAATKPTYTYSEVGAAAASHSHAQADVTGLVTALSGKSDTGHTHSYAGSATAGGDATNALSLGGVPAVNYATLSTSQALTNKTYNGFTLAAACAKGVDTSPVSASANVITSGGVFTALSGKSDTGHAHAQSDVTGLVTALSGKSNTGHTHTPAEAGAAAASHDHDASDIISGALAILRGGTGASDVVNAVKNLMYLGTDPSFVDTTANWAAKGLCWAFYATSVVSSVTNKPTQYGFLLNIPIPGSAEVHQIYFPQATGSSGGIYHRGGNASGWYADGWRTVHDSATVVPVTDGGTGGTTQATAFSNVVAAGGTLTGALVPHVGTDYTTVRARGIALVTALPTVTTANNGQIYMLYA